MKILSHRGLWLDVGEKNSALALARSFARRYGTETDLRDHNGTLVVSHDIATASSLTADVFFELHAAVHPDLPIALNIKSDGLQHLLLEQLRRFDVEDAFVFDMSIPDTLAWFKVGVQVFCRQSEYEPDPVCYERCSGVWLDCFHSEWWDDSVIDRHLVNGKRVAIVSPDLHGRDPEPLWERLRAARYRSDERVMVCTDMPETADRVIHD